MTLPSDSVPHAPDCGCNKTLHRFKCRWCKRVVGWCMGAHDAVERRSGPICDDCWYQISLTEDSLLDLAEKRTRTVILTPLQVREAIVEWAYRNCAFPPHWDEIDSLDTLVTINADDTASVKMVRHEKTKEQP
jgi:hypothetical protein